ncbi:MAG: CDP-alcohol phosphatidyltransferase family protein [Proteobacteria bacterium]|nr:CDP-alcohol phosphatidyltransferase family protein [Pseudomonadota bacterium]MDA1132823.1 CDP-alcohol phosphatidyltransferase family protein [Pseudomonadota bacterium]
MNAPNLISLVRLLAVPLVVWLTLEGHGVWAFWVFVGAGVSDAIDGAIAKRFGLATDLGRYLDPIADKVLLVAVYVTLGSAGAVATWLVMLVVTRDALIVGGAMLSQARGHGVQIQPLLLSKVNTAMQIVLAAALLGELAYGSFAELAAPWVKPVLVWTVAATTTASGIVYLWRWGAAAPEEA